MVANKGSYILSALYYSHYSWLADLSLGIRSERHSGLYELSNGPSLETSCLEVQEYGAVVAVCLDSSQEVALNHRNKFSAASLKPFVLVNCRSEKVTLNRALREKESFMEEICPLSLSSRSSSFLPKAHSLITALHWALLP